MLKTSIKAHRDYLLAESPGQKLFLALHLQADQAAAAARPDLSVVFVVDTSGSMRETVTEPRERTGQITYQDGQRYEVVHGGQTKMDLVVAALEGIVKSRLLNEQDRVALVKFDDHAEVLLPFTPGDEQTRLLDAVHYLPQFSGGTEMGEGMERGTRLLGNTQGSRRMVLLTDGQAFDAAVAEGQAKFLADLHVPVTAVGVGDDVNTDLLTRIADLTQGQVIDVVADSEQPKPPAVRATELPKALLGDLQQAVSEVITNVNLSVRSVQDVVLNRVTRVQPTQTEVTVGSGPMPLGNVDAQAGATYVLEFTLPARPAARMRLSQLGLTYEVPGAGHRGELPPLDVVVEFTSDEALAGHLDQTVMQWVQQRNIEGLVAQATREAQSDPQQAAKTLALARNMTQRLGNGAMTQVLDRAIEELGSSKTISLGTAKTLKMGAKTQTLKEGEASSTLPSDEEIRRMTGA